jgi:hypothetical protein
MCFLVDQTCATIHKTNADDFTVFKDPTIALGQVSKKSANNFHISSAKVSTPIQVLRPYAELICFPKSPFLLTTQL